MLDKLSVGQVLEELADYCVSHFAFEESLQREVGYKLAEAHQAAHEIFARRMAKYQERYAAGEDVGKQLHGMLSTWLVHHIKRDDMAYVPDVMGMARNRQQGDWPSRSGAGFFGEGK